MPVDDIASSARVAYIDYPAQVDDLIADRHPDDKLSFAAVAGYAIVASSAVDQAFLFSIPAGSASDAIPITLPPSTTTSSNHSVSLAMWLAERTTTSIAKSLGIAILSHDAVLRIYPRVPVEQSIPSANLPCIQIHVDEALAQSIGDDNYNNNNNSNNNNNNPCNALHVTRLESSDSQLIVFGTRGSAALVSFTLRDSNVQPLPRDSSSSLASQSERSSLRFGSIFYSAIRSIGAGIGGRDTHWHSGTGPYEIVDSHSYDDSIVLVHKGGEVERWNLNGLVWSFNAFNNTSSQSVSSLDSVISSAFTSEGTLVLLAQYPSEQGLDRLLKCYDIRGEEAPITHHMSIPVDSAPDPENSSFGIVVCSDIVFLFNPEMGRLAWRSVARGVPAEGQVQGSLDANAVGEMYFLADVSRGLHSSPTSGIAACLHQDGIMLSCFEVPAPVSEDVLAVSSERVTISGSVSILWRSFLQYSANQKGAARASLQGLVNILVSKGFDTSEALSQLVLLLSRDIVTKDVHTFSDDRKTLLIDTALIRKIQSHLVFLKMLSDVELFTQVRPDAPSIAEDRIWDALDLSCRFSVMTDNEMLAAAYAIRQVENAESVRNFNGGFNEAASNLMGTAKVVEIARALRVSLICENENLREGLNTVNMALVRVGQQVCDNEKMAQGNDMSTELYRKAHEFFKFVPALNACVIETLQRLSYEHNVPDEENLENQSMLLGEARSVVSLSCEAAIALLESAMEARSESSKFLSRGLVGLDGMRSWLLETNDCISAFQSIAKQSMIIGLKSSDRERGSIMGLATLVIDKLLASARQGEGSTRRNFRGGGSSGNTKGRLNTDRGQSKRRRLELRDVNSEWRRLLRSCMKLLRDHELDEEAFRLAEKYGDFETMMALKVNAEEFNAFMEKSISTFGPEFAKFAFSWLEEKGRVELLLRGRTEVSDEGVVKQSCCELEPLKGLLSDYFNNERKNSCNLSWMHWLAIGDVNKGLQAVEKQMKHCAKPGKIGSLGNTRFLSSIAKLSALCVSDDIEDINEENTKRFEQASAHLDLLLLQESLFEDDKENVKSGTEIVRGLVDMCGTDSEELGERVASAIDAVALCESIEDEGWGQKDYVWRRCVERQETNWISLAKQADKYSDVEIRDRLTQTALYVAAKRSRLLEADIDELLNRGMLEGSKIEAEGMLSQVSVLVRTAIALAASSNSDEEEEEAGVAAAATLTPIEAPDGQVERMVLVE